MNLLGVLTVLGVVALAVIAGLAVSFFFAFLIIAAGDDRVE